jgi:glycosyltransferase involved in cell wall biosynthesis
MKILIIANARIKGGLSGGDNIYLNFKRYWKADVDVWEMMDINFKPFCLCYLYRIIVSIWRAKRCKKHYDFVYSASDFLMDSLPALVMKRKGNKWVAGFFLFAPKDNRIYLYLQTVAFVLIKRFADMVIVTNPTMFHPFEGKKITWINGGIDISLAGFSDRVKIYDAVFCGRIHPTKGIEELLAIWEFVIKHNPKARLAIIGDGDLGIGYLKNRIALNSFGISLLGYMGEERYEIYKKSKVVLYPTPEKYDHFSMAPVEAMACGCPMIAWKTPIMDFFQSVIGMRGAILVEPADSINAFAYAILDNIDGKWKENRIKAFDFAKRFNYKQQAENVLRQIKERICV